MLTNDELALNKGENELIYPTLHTLRDFVVCLANEKETWAI